VLADRLAGRDDALDGTLRQAVAAWLGGDTAALDPAWYRSAFEVEVSKGGLAAAKVLADRALGSEDQVLRPTVLAIVANSGKPEIARWLLEELKDPRLRPTERRGLLGGIMQRSATRDYGYGWLKANLDALMQGGGIFFTAKLPQLLTSFCSGAKAAEIERDLGPRFVGQTGALEMARSLERIRDCARLKDARRAEVSNEIARLK